MVRDVGQSVEDERLSHCGVVVASVVVATESLAAGSMMTVLVLVEVRPDWSVAT